MRPQFTRPLHAACSLLVLIALLSAGCEKWTQERINANIQILKDEHASKEKRQAAAAALGRMGKPALPALFAMMRPQYRHAEYYIGYAIAGMGPQAYPELIKGLDDQEPFVRGLCASGMIALARHFDDQTTAAVKGLIRMMARDAGEPALQYAAMMALEKFGAAARPAIPSLLAATLAEDWKLCETAAKTVEAIDPESLKLVPRPPQEPKGFFASFKAHSEWDAQRFMAVMGRLEYGRYDVNGDWRLTPDEIASEAQLLKGLKAAKKEFLTFAEAGAIAFADALEGYAAGSADSRKIDKKVVQQELENPMARNGVAMMMIMSLRGADADHDGVLSKAEREAWHKSVQALPGAAEPHPSGEPAR